MVIYTLDVPAGPDRLLWYAMALFAAVAVASSVLGLVGAYRAAGADRVPLWHRLVSGTLLTTGVVSALCCMCTLVHLTVSGPGPRGLDEALSERFSASTAISCPSSRPGYSRCLLSRDGDVIGVNTRYVSGSYEVTAEDTGPAGYPPQALVTSKDH